jgi:hypothetical protein
LSDDGARLSQVLLDKAVNAASRAVDDWTGRRFWQDPVVVVRQYRPARCDLVAVDDISTATGLIVQTRESAGGTWTVWTLGTDFELGPDNADADGPAYAWCKLTAIGPRFFPLARFRTLQVTAKWGWSAIPDQVMEATLLRAVAIFKRKETPYGIADFGEFGPVRIGRQDADVIALLSPFQRVMVA